MPRINLLPWREQQRKERKLAFLVALGGATVAAVLATFAGYLLFNSLISSQESRNATLSGEIKVLDRQIQEINDLESQKQRFISRMQVIDKLQRSRSEVVHLFDEVATMMPDGTYLTAFKQTNRRLKFSGVAQSSTRVSTFMRNIAASQWVRDPELEVVQSTRENSLGNSFVLYADQIPQPGDEPESVAAPRRGARAGGAN
jgi:type IV pilus assembly protein PilN